VPPPLSATELSRAIRSGRHTARDAVDDALRRIRAGNDRLNAVVTLDEPGARRRARDADAALARGESWGPLHGVPVTVKDQFSTKGMRTTYGLPPYRRWVPNRDAAMVARLKRAGAILLGKTNLPFASYDWQCLNPSFGRAHNPWARDYTPGGSSGGAAAALSAGFVPLEIGADVGGSIRLPAHFCGVYGLRPTDKRLPTQGMVPSDRPMTVRNVVVPGPMARSVEDLQLAFHVLDTPVDEPLPAYSAPESPPLPGLRMAVTPSLGGVPPDTDTQRTLRSFCQNLTRGGATVEHVPSPINIDEALDVWGRIQGYELTAGLPWVARHGPLRELIWNGAIRGMYGFLASYLARGSRLGSRGYLDALADRDRLTAQIDAFMSDVDAWITPVCALPAFRQCWTGTTLDIDGEPVPYSLPFAAYLPALAVPGHPIATLPAGFSTPQADAPRRPIGLQVHGQPGRDAELLSVCRALDAAGPGYTPPPCS
jgi:amidase